MRKPALILLAMGILGGCAAPRYSGQEIEQAYRAAVQDLTTPKTIEEPQEIQFVMPNAQLHPVYLYPSPIPIAGSFWQGSYTPQQEHYTENPHRDSHKRPRTGLEFGGIINSVLDLEKLLGDVSITLGTEGSYLTLPVNETWKFSIGAVDGFRHGTDENFIGIWFTRTFD